MFNKFTSTKETNIFAFLRIVPNLKTLSQQSVITLAERFIISPESFALLINIATNGGCFNEN